MAPGVQADAAWRSGVPVPAVPLVVDLDGTLLRTDTLVESLALQAKADPLSLLALPAWLLRGRAGFKRALAERVLPAAQALPFHAGLLDFLREQQRSGRRLVLATGADERVARRIADRLDLFDEVLASDGRHNLAGEAKRRRLVQRFGERGYDYAGNSRRDLPAWRSARRAIVVGARPALAAEVGRHTPVERRLGHPAPALPVLLHALRWHHWPKNLLVLVPLLAAGLPQGLPVLLAALAAFAGFCLAASSVYLLNDLVDLPEDRRHPHKRERPLASGRLPPPLALALVPALWAGAAALASTLPPGYGATLAGYVVLMLAYSLRLKDHKVVDALALGSGYTLRLVAGAAALRLALPWSLVLWSLLAFFGLAMLKRRAELAVALKRGAVDAHARAYHSNDASMIDALGRGAGFAAALVLALHPVLDARPAAAAWPVWGLCVLQLAWTRHLWRMACQGGIRDDPVAFVLRDGRSRGAAGLLLLILAGAAAANAEPASIVTLQHGRESSVVAAAGAAGPGQWRLVNLNPAANAWFVLQHEDAAGRVLAAEHLENADPQRQHLRLDAAGGGALEITTAGGTVRCTPWAGAPASALQPARRSGAAFEPLCDGRLFLRLPVRGNRSALEATTEFLRDHVWGGEHIVGFVRREFFRDAFVERGVVASAPDVSASGAAADAPGPARLKAGAEPPPVMAEGLGIEVEGNAAVFVPGRWQRVAGLPGVHLSVYLPAALPEAARAAGPDAVEAQALVFLVAFDLDRYELGFTLGTEHPRLGWSARVPAAQRTPSPAGPDGIDDAAPLVRSGLLSPPLQARAAATFTGGFKREHGAFRHGPLAQRQQGSHYGFVEQGVVFSRLVPGLATLYVLGDGKVGLRTWTEADDALLPRLRDARQNGVPLVEPGADGAPALGALVGQWGAGNWSGSADEQLRTLRAGACLLDDGRRRHLAYGYFSSATPTTMARVFLAYGCRYAMHLDMNALEHTYLAVYAARGERRLVQHLVKGMAVLDKRSGAGVLPRFLGFPDDRDFFYLLHKPPR